MIYDGSWQGIPSFRKHLLSRKWNVAPETEAAAWYVVAPLIGRTSPCLFAALALALFGRSKAANRRDTSALLRLRSVNSHAFARVCRCSYQEPPNKDARAWDKCGIAVVVKYRLGRDKILNIWGSKRKEMASHPLPDQLKLCLRRSTWEVT